MGWGLPGILRLLPSPTLVVVDHVRHTLDSLEPGSAILDVGAGGRRIAPNATTFDACPGPNVDVVGDIHAMQFADNSYDCVFCTGTLEHVANPWRAVEEIHRVVRPGGIVYVDVPFIQGYHADPTDYWRFTIDGLRHLCCSFVEMESGVHIGPTCGLIWIAREWANSVRDDRYLSNLCLIVVALVTAPFKYLDYFMLKSPRSHRVASAVFFRGRKPSVEQTNG
jgi:SAM-dependent methyltransferase